MLNDYSMECECDVCVPISGPLLNDAEYANQTCTLLSVLRVHFSEPHLNDADYAN